MAAKEPQRHSPFTGQRILGAGKRIQRQLRPVEYYKLLYNIQLDSPTTTAHGQPRRVAPQQGSLF